MSRTFYQSHECEGFRAKVTIEWDIPPTSDENGEYIKRRLADAEDIADSILAFSGKKMRDMVQTMRGYHPVVGTAPSRDSASQGGDK